MRKVYDWDSGVYLGDIPEVDETYNVVGNSNEHGLVIGESTFGGIAPLAWNQSGAIIDYGSLIYITLQRSKTVQEAIHTMVGLMDTYGYASGGESFSLTDKSGQVWMMEVIGRGNELSKGAVWVAQRIPDGAVAAHANQARITTFPRNDPENCLYAEDVVDVAIHYGLYTPDPSDPDHTNFSFSDVYNPLSFVSARQVRQISQRKSSLCRSHSKLVTSFVISRVKRVFGPFFRKSWGRRLHRNTKPTLSARSLPSGCHCIFTRPTTTDYQSWM